MRDLLNSHFKGVITKFWEKEVRFNQRTLFDLAEELDNIEWYDEEVWTLIFSTAVTKKRINNLHYFTKIHKLMHKLNTGGADDLYGHLNGKYDAYLKILIDRHYTEDRKWKYNAETFEMRTL